MAQNTLPIFTNVPEISWTGNITAANTAKDGTGTVLTGFTADATDGSFVQRVIAKPAGTNVASLARVFINNGSSNGTAANNSYFMDIDLPATTLSETATMAFIERAINIALPAGYKLNVVLATAVAAGWTFSFVGGDY
jgi:hypothetical protein